MKAAFLETVGGPEVLQYDDLPTPEPRDGEILVKVEAASINPIDVYLRSGMVKADLPKPFIPGCDFAGTVAAIGIGVTRYRVGDRVWGSNQGLLGRQGTLAEFCSVAEEFVYPLPEDVAPKTAAAVALVGITAHLALFHRAKLQKEESVFISGGAGGVGSAAVRMAKATGARVLTTVGGAVKKAKLLACGADVVIDYKSEDVGKAIDAATGGKGVDVWLETQPPTDFDAIFARLVPFGRIVTIAGRTARPEFPNGPFYVKGLSLFGFAMFNLPADIQRRAADEMNWWLTDDKLTLEIGAEFPLAEAAQAHRLQEENTLGKAGTLSGKIIVYPG